MKIEIKHYQTGETWRIEYPGPDGYNEFMKDIHRQIDKSIGGTLLYRGKVLNKEIYESNDISTSKRLYFVPRRSGVKRKLQGSGTLQYYLNTYENMKGRKMYKVREFLKFCSDSGYLISGGNDTDSCRAKADAQIDRPKLTESMLADPNFDYDQYYQDLLQWTNLYNDCMNNQ